jgi:hypothetical protein
MMSALGQKRTWLFDHFGARPRPDIRLGSQTEKSTRPKCARCGGIVPA